MPTFYDRFVECAERWPQNVAVEVQRPDGIESHSYAELRRMAEAIAAWLLGRGIEAGERVAILADNHPRWVAAYLGIIAAGGTTVPLDTAYHADQVSKLLRDSGTSLLICDQKHLEVARGAVAGTDIVIVQTDSGMSKNGRAGTPVAPRSEIDFDSVFAHLDAQGGTNFRPIPREPDDIASLLYTSGTTADPKGVMLTHANLLAEADAVFAWAHIGPDDAILGVLPLFHVLSQMANLLLPLVAGTRVVYLSTLNTTELLRALRERNVTAFAVVPQFFNLIHERIFKEVQHRGALARLAFKWLMRLNVSCRKFGFNPGRVFFRRIHDLFGRRMRYLVTGGSRFDPQIARDFYAHGIDVLQAYGLTETCGGAFANSPEENVIGSVGRPLKGIEGKILNNDAQPSDDGSPASGEILIRGPIVMKGYWNRPDATAEVIKDGWLHTGDLGHFDEHGNLFITGRQKDVIILANGKNVYPEEIEAHYLQSPLIKEICVLGLQDGGLEKLYAVITPNFEVLRQRKIVNAKEVIRFDVEGLSAKLPSTKRIAGYEIWQEDLPRTSTRKLKRFEIEKRAGAGKHDGSDAERTISKPLTQEDTSWLEQPDNQRALKVIREYSPDHPEKISPADNLELDLGLDSMRRVELLVAVEQELGGDVEESRLADIYTVRELVDAVRESVASGKSPAKQFAGWGDVLRQDPTDSAVLAITEPRPFTDRLIFVLTRLFKLVWKSFSRIEVEGLENLPHKGAFLLCSNHQSFIDPLPLLSVLPWWLLKRMFAVGTSEIFGSGLMVWVAKFMRVVVVDPDAHLIPAMRAGAYGLRHGMSLIMYPEGERSIDGTPKTFKKGAAILSVRLQVPIVPMAIDGFYEAWPRGKPFQKFAPLKMKIGKPVRPPAESEGSEEAYAKLTAELKEKVVGMWEEIRN